MTGTMKGRRKLLCQLRQTSKQREIRNREGCRGRQYKGLPNAAVCGVTDFCVVCLEQSYKVQEGRCDDCRASKEEIRETLVLSSLR